MLANFVLWTSVSLDRSDYILWWDYNSLDKNDYINIRDILRLLTTTAWRLGFQKLHNIIEHVMYWMLQGAK